MLYAAWDDDGANEVATQVVVGLGGTVVVVVLVVVLGAVLVVVATVVVVGLVVVVAGTVVVAWVVATAAVELGSVVDDDGEPPHELATEASAAVSAATGRSALGPIVR
jgi:hypothetical protein